MNLSAFQVTAMATTSKMSKVDDTHPLLWLRLLKAQRLTLSPPFSFGPLGASRRESLVSLGYSIS